MQNSPQGVTRGFVLTPRPLLGRHAPRGGQRPILKGLKPMTTPTKNKYGPVVLEMSFYYYRWQVVDV